jgi:hypothetical protein
MTTQMKWTLREKAQLILSVAAIFAGVATIVLEAMR